MRFLPFGRKIKGDGVCHKEQQENGEKVVGIYDMNKEITAILQYGGYKY